MASLCVIDCSLVACAAPRRFLMGLSAATGERLAITPAVRTEMLRLVAYSERQFIRERTSEWSDDYGDMVRERVTDWLDTDFLGPSGVFDVCAAKTESDREQWIDRLPTEAFKARTDAGAVNDMLIVADALAGGAEGLMTNNCGTMFHHVLNDWAVRSGVRNSPFMLEPAPGVAQLMARHGRRFPDEPFLHQCAVNMVMPNTRMAPHEERELLIRFGDKLNASMPGIGNTLIVEERTRGRDARWDRAAQLIGTREWRRVRDVETKRMDRMRRARSSVGLRF